ncbi:MAG: hypothetical protein MPJ78_14980 [Hyphomicrobiaceae bacterium]|nr:hypothetical protein [Hyphomicrobiaceae bacterium]
MMADKASQISGKNADPYQARTAANMADALSFLIRIALQSGMKDVAVSLTEVRKKLQAISAHSDTSVTKKRLGTGHRESDRLNRPN